VSGGALLPDQHFEFPKFGAEPKVHKKVRGFLTGVCIRSGEFDPRVGPMVRSLGAEKGGMEWDGTVAKQGPRALPLMN
jgi:hypothetical protein